MITIGEWEIHHVKGGTLRYDGGSMFGVVPKPLWERKAPADARNRIAMSTNCLLLRRAGQNVLIDTGYGTKFTPKQRERYDLEAGDVLVENLRQIGVSPEEVETVFLTHLHFDHVGGATRCNSHGEVTPVFPRARHVVQRLEWETALSAAPELGDAYPLENILPLQEAGLLDFIEGDVPIFPGIQALVTSGHTQGHQALLIRGAGHTAFYPADLCPMTAHLRQMWCMAFDVSPLETRRRKAEWLGRAADEHWLVLWSHDPQIVGGYLRRDDKEEFVVEEPWMARP